MTQDSGDSSDSTPTLSVIIACRDVQDVLGVQLAALASQPCPVPWELLICDNGSTDGTVALAGSWADRLRLRVIDASAIAGSGPARNAGVDVARGKWIGFCDADDEVADNWLETLCRALAAHSFVAGRLDGERLNSSRTLRSRALDQQDGLQFSSRVVGLPHAGALNMGIHRSVFLDVGGFDPAVRYLQDTDLCWRVQLAGHPLVFVPELVVHARLRASLWSMFRQGRNYGASHASLEQRYAGAAARAGAASRSTIAAPEYARHGASSAEPAEASVIDLTTDDASRDTSGSPSHRRHPLLGVARLARFFVIHRSSIHAQAWQLGWHIGHRS